MEKKTNCRSIRFNDQIRDLIEAQVGETFTDKFENLVTRCAFELPRKEEELEKINKEIKRKQQQMAEASSRYARMINQLGSLEKKLYDLDYAIGRALDEWPNYEP